MKQREAHKTYEGAQREPLAGLAIGRFGRGAPQTQRPGRAVKGAEGGSITRVSQVAGLAPLDPSPMFESDVATKA